MSVHTSVMEEDPHATNGAALTDTASPAVTAAASMSGPAGEVTTSADQSEAAAAGAPVRRVSFPVDLGASFVHGCNQFNPVLAPYIHC
jgi:hypothetical protein